MHPYLREPPSCSAFQGHRTVAALMALAVLLIHIGAATAATWILSEDFTTALRRDPVLSTAWWDTLAGELKLPPLLLEDVGSYNTPGTAYASERRGGYLLVADGESNNLLSLGVTDPTTLSLAATLPTGAMVRDLALDGDWAYLGLGSGLGVLTVDISDPATPLYGTRLDLNGFAGGVAAASGWIYVAQSNAGVAVVNAADPLAPTLADTVGTGEFARDVALAGNILLVADSGAGLTLLDVTAPAAPTYLGRLDVDGWCYGVTAAGTVAYLAIGNDGLLLVDISNPAAPAPLGSLDLDGFSQHVTVAADTAYVASGDAGLHLVDVSVPSQPQLLGNRDPGGYAYHTLWDGTTAWLCEGTGGVHGFQPDADGLDVVRNVAASINLNDSGDPVQRARMAADCDDTVRFALTVDGGATWIDVGNGDDWMTIEPIGTDLRWRALLSPGPAGGAPVCRDLTLEWETRDSFGAILSVDDVPGDDGGQVRVQWSASRFDIADGDHLVTEYSLYRRYEASTAARSLPSTVAAYPPGQWEYLLTVPADREALYAATVPSVGDSTASGIPWTVLFVRTRTDAPSVYFDSPPDSGYSLNNLAPPPPTGLTIDRLTPGGVQLAWDPSPLVDFAHFRVYRTPSPAILPSPAYLHHVTTGTSFYDATELLWFYQLTVVDLAGAESAPADVPVAAPSGPPPRLHLAQNTPNPFNPTTFIDLSVPGGQSIDVRIFDPRGRLVTVLNATELPPGPTRFRWDGRDTAGRAQPSGLYTCRVQAGGAGRSIKMMLIR